MPHTKAEIIRKQGGTPLADDYETEELTRMKKTLENELRWVEAELFRRRLVMRMGRE